MNYLDHHFVQNTLPEHKNTLMILPTLCPSKFVGAPSILAVLSHNLAFLRLSKRFDLNQFDDSKLTSTLKKDFHLHHTLMNLMISLLVNNDKILALKKLETKNRDSN